MSAEDRIRDEIFLMEMEKKKKRKKCKLSQGLQYLRGVGKASPLCKVLMEKLGVPLNYKATCRAKSIFSISKSERHWSDS